MFHVKTFKLTFLFLVFAGGAAAQEIAAHVLNTSNGLSSNHVYHAVRDRFGYLWIATESGVAKYNGYKVTLFGNESGMRNENVWHLFADRKGRVWPSNISSEIGYFYNDKYYKAVLSDIKKPIYPSCFRDHDNGILFLNSDVERWVRLCTERNDTINEHNLRFNEFGCYVHISKEHLFLQRTSGFYMYEPGKNSWIRKYGYTSDTPAYLYNDVLIPLQAHSNKPHTVTFYNIHNGEQNILKLDAGESLYMRNVANNNCYLTTSKHIYKLTPQMQLLTVTSVDHLLANKVLKENDLLTYSDDSLWGEWVTTQTSGMVILLSGNGFQFQITKRKGEADNMGATPSRVSSNIFKRLQLSNGRIMAVTANGVRWLLENDSMEFIKNSQYPNNIKAVDGNLKSDSELYLVRTGEGLIKVNPLVTPALTELLNKERYSHISYDSFRKVIVAYGRDNIYWEWRGAKKLLKMLQPVAIDKILFDNLHKNIFVKTEKELWMVDPRNFTFKRLFPHINLKSSYVFINKNLLILAGRFGVAYSSVKGPGRVSAPYVVSNQKKSFYDFVSSAYLSPEENLILNTDKGTMIAPSPADSIFEKARTQIGQRYQLAFSYNDTIYRWDDREVLPVIQTNPALRFDLINPYGAGPVNYKYRILAVSENWVHLPDNQLLLPQLTPGNIYTLQVQAGDDLMQTKVMELQLFVIPYWWQTGYGKTGIGAAILLLLALLSWAVVEITKRRVNQKNLRENLTLEVKNLNQALELKSIYAQLDPHFIFNTLNTGLYFIKKKKTEDAYDHFVSFSHLLRAYIKSSRNKFILLSEEVTNLGNYITLQQSRFDNKFDYEIVVAPNVGKKARIPSLLLQPIVENAINHGLTHKQHGGKLLVEFRVMDGKDLVCIVDDNGIGRTKAKEFKEASKVTTTSYGTDLIKELIALLNKEAKVRIELEYIDKQPPLEGTTVIITIHNIYNAS